jgi:hypothetical protein
MERFGWYLIGAWALFFAVWAGFENDMDRSAWAAWVQAVGSIGAIAGALFIGLQQQEHARALQVEARRHDELRKLDTVKAILVSVEVCCTDLAEKWDKAQFATLLQAEIVPVADCKMAVESIPLFDVPDGHLVILVSSMPRKLQYLIDSIVAISPERLGLRSGSGFAETFEKTLASTRELVFMTLARCDALRRERGGAFDSE